MSDQDIANVIAAHHPLGLVCRCGEDTLSTNGWARHVLAALRERNAIVELPKPTVNGPHLEWRRLCFEAVVWTIPGGHIMIQNIEPGDLMPSNARDVAAAILAAADVADRSEERIAAAEADQ